MPSTAPRRPRPPSGLNARARALWRDLHDSFEFGRDERELLVEVCRTLTAMDQLQAVVDKDGPLSTGSTGQLVEHPAAVGLRAHRAMLSRLLKQLALPDDLDDEEAEKRGATSLRSKAASHAARARWGS